MATLAELHGDQLPLHPFPADGPARATAADAAVARPAALWPAARGLRADDLSAAEGGSQTPGWQGDLRLGRRVAGRLPQIVPSGTKVYNHTEHFWFWTEVPQDVMLRTKTIEDQLRKGRLEAKTLDSMFRRRIEEGANCAPFVSQAILKTVKELYPLDHDGLQQQLDVGQIKLLVVAAEEPPGKPLEYSNRLPSLA